MYGTAEISPNFAENLQMSQFMWISEFPFWTSWNARITLEQNQLGGHADCRKSKLGASRALWHLVMIVTFWIILGPVLTKSLCRSFETLPLVSLTFPRKGRGASPSFQQLVWQSQDEFNWRREFSCTMVRCFLDELPGEAHHINKKLHCRGAWLWNPNMAYFVLWRAYMSDQKVYSKPGHNWRNVNSFHFSPFNACIRSSTDPTYHIVRWH